MHIQIFHYYISNSIKHGKSGSKININVKTGSGPSNFVYIKIKNRGERFGECVPGSDFQCFHKGDASFSRCNEGAGVGLYLAKSLVELQGGKLFLATSEKEEIEVYAVFPLMEKILRERIDDISLWELEEKYIKERYIKEKYMKEKAAIELSDIYT